ncbi:MAG TPA: undecaprenyl-phosphate glucose phosphotransferase [Hanamia sp.]
MNKQFDRYLQISLVILDLVVLNVLYFLYEVIFLKSKSLFSILPFILYWIVSVALWLLLGFILSTYIARVILNFETFTKKTLRTYLLWIIFILFYPFFAKEFTISSLFIITSIVFFGIGLLINRFIYLGIYAYFKNNGYLIKKVIIVGYNDTAKKLSRYFEEDRLNTQMRGYIENEENIHELSHYPILANISETLKIAKQLNIREIFSTITPEENTEIYNLMYKAEKECIRFKIVPNLSFFIKSRVHMEYFGDLPVLSLRFEPLDDLGNRIKKRFLDIIISVFVIVFILSWLVPLLAVLICLDSKGPVFFKQIRMGQNNKPFTCLKFRTMKPNKDSETKQAMKNDPRITRLGIILRKTSLDEFPQFINVLKGEMSIVGPRPHPMNLNDKFKKIIDEYPIRQFMKPGITGWAQINGFRGETKNVEQMEKRIEYDLLYMESWTLWFDVRIVFLTVYSIFNGDENAY